MKKTISLLLLVVLCLSLCACGSGAPKSQDAAAIPEAAYDNGYYYDSDVAEMEMAYDEEGGYGFSASNAMTAKGSDAPEQRPGKIIYSANVQVETTDFDGSVEKLEALVDEYGGWVESSSVNGANYADRSRGSVSRRSASYTLRFPSERFDQLMSSLSGLGNIPYTHTYTENVTAQYYDVQARLTAYTTQEQRLLEMMEIAESVEDVILLEDRLAEVRYRIEGLQSSLNNWDRQVSYSTVYLDLNEVQEYSPEPQIQPSYGQQLLNALKAGLHGAGSFFKGLLLWLVEALPALIVLAVIVVLLILAAKKRAKKRKEKMAAVAARVTAAPAEPQKEELK